MAGTPKWKVYTCEGEYIAACSYIEDALTLCTSNGDGTTIRFNHGKPLWTQGSESATTQGSIPYAVAAIQARLDGRSQETDAKCKAAMERHAATHPVKS